MSVKSTIFSIVLTLSIIGQIVLALLLYNEAGNPFLRTLGWIIMWISAVFGWMPIFTFKKWGGVRKGKSYVNTTRLVDRGLYAVVRHPQYLAGMLISVSLPLIAQHWIVAIPGILAIVVNYLDTFEEEKAALEKFGDPYRKYIESVPRINALSGILRLLIRQKHIR